VVNKQKIIEHTIRLEQGCTSLLIPFCRFSL